MEEGRASPDELLKKIESEESARVKGHLKIFFGYAAGVGKTYAMLKAAHSAKRRSMDVIIGYLEPHTRQETLALAQGLEKLPALEANHNGVHLHEFDLDAAILRKPRLILVDELAHTNAVGCRHLKRYQDVIELLKAGIDVYTTVNVQHIESLNDMIASITGISVRERIPDSIFDDADQVELVDIEPQELLERLSAGKVYRDAQAQQALSHFFNLKNLTALREITLRRCADRVNHMALSARTSPKEDFFTDEHILVCLSSSPTNGKIIRTAARMASAFKGSFTALFVETPDFPNMCEEDKTSLRKNMKLAQQLGASIETVFSDDIPFQIAEFARLSAVSKVVLGRSSTQKKHFFSKPTLTERLITLAPNLDVYIIPDKAARPYSIAKSGHKSTRFMLSDTFKSVFLLVAATVTGTLFRQFGFSEANIITVYILSVLLTAVTTTQRMYSLISSIVSVFVFNYFFTRPYFSFLAYDQGYPITFLIMFASAFITSTLAARLKLQAKQASKAAYRTKILLETNQLIQKGKDQAAIAAVVANQLVKLLKRDVVIYLVQKERHALLEPMVYLANDQSTAESYTTPNERAVAVWVYHNNKHAGATTSTLGNAKCLYLAIRANEVVYGVVGIAMPAEAPDAFANSITLSMLGECALALEHEVALREREQSALATKNEQLRANLLRSISHDLRTPLTSISGNAGILLDNGEHMDAQKRKQLYVDIYDDSLWLINLVENLLSVTRIEDGTMKLRMNAELIDEVISEALLHINRKASEHKIVVHGADELLLARMDARLIVQVLINIVDNAIKYTPIGSEIVLSTVKQGNWVVISVADNGDGISDEAKSHIFEMFYTVNNGIADSRRSLGLGLSLCKSIITAHGGDITVLDHQPHGTMIRFTLPAEEVILRE
ncbi:MAG: sensor histidine kinase KdpD [Clostridia bacterium]